MITILLTKIKDLLIELKTNIENIKSSIDYSTNEQKIGKWIDNSDLYQITKDLEIETFGSDINVSGLPTNVTFLEDSAMLYTKTYSNPINFATAAGSSSRLTLDEINSETGTCRLFVGGDYSIFENVHVCITLKYIKNTEA